MPFDLAMVSDLSRRQFHSVAQALLVESERLERKNSNQAETIKQYQDQVSGGDLSLGMLIAERDELKAEIDRLRTAEGDAMTYKAGMENVAQQRDQLKAELEKVKADRKACWEEFKVQGRQLDQLKQENRLLTEHNEFLASSDSRLAPELRAVKDALGLDFTASVSGEVVPLIERLRKLPTCWTEVLEQSEANDQLLDQVLELSADANRYRFIVDCPIRTMVALSRKATEADFDLSAECDQLMRKIAARQ